MFAGKRELLARALRGRGVTAVLERMPVRDVLLVLNYHRLGNAAANLFDPGVFSATADEFDGHLAGLKRLVSFVTLEEAQAYVAGTLRDNTRRCRVLMTFDDGYLDNYTTAFPILRSHGVQGVFFLSTNLVGSHTVPWWDRIAYTLRTARRNAFRLHYPSELAVALTPAGWENSLKQVLRLYKQPANTEPERFMRQLREAAEADEVPPTARQFLDWDEARSMLAAGMAIGSHAHTHTVLAQLPVERQREELRLSREILSMQLRTPINTLAYPVGGPTSYSPDTQRLAAECGYRAAFAFCGGANRRGSKQLYAIRRHGVDGQSPERLETQVALFRVSRKYWP
jgi:peptidoglycan/xylan/chitin deacetylase (PgdA/CDA1 family)